MTLIDADVFLAYLIFSKHIDSLKCRDVKEAVEMSKVDVLDKIRDEIEQARDMAIKALERNPYDFAIWVAREIFDENWEYNKEAFAEIACRKLAKLGIVIRMGDEWELVESLERSGEE